MTGSTNVTLKCATAEQTGCAESVSVQTYEDKASKTRKPVQVYPHICLACWRKGWRFDAPIKQDDPWRVYQLEGHPQVLNG